MDIELERKIELALEVHHWFDLLRTERAIQVMTEHGVREKSNPSTPAAHERDMVVNF